MSRRVTDTFSDVNTETFARPDLSREQTVSRAATLLRLSWDAAKDLEKQYRLFGANKHLFRTYLLKESLRLKILASFIPEG